MQPCSFKGCPRPMIAKGLCGSHYKQSIRGTTLRPLRLEKLVKIPSPRVSQETAAALRRINTNLYRAANAALEQWRAARVK